MKASMRKIKVIVEGEEYIVEVGDLDVRPITVMVDGEYYQVEVEEDEVVGVTPSAPSEPIAAPKPATPSTPQRPSPNAMTGKAITAPLPGDVVDILVNPGEKVAVGQAVCVVEAMKMKNTIRSPREGVIATIDIIKGDAVQFGETLMTFE